MKRTSFSYQLPPNLIAQSPSVPRDHARLLLCPRRRGALSHQHFYDLPEVLQKGDVLVLNNTKVFPARLMGRKETGGRIEIFLLREVQRGKNQVIWEVLVGKAKPRVGLKVSFAQRHASARLKNSAATKKTQTETTEAGELVKQVEHAVWHMRFNRGARDFWKMVAQIGQTPLPPYIKMSSKFKVKSSKSYQTIYAKYTGSVAAPTAGLHFTKPLLKKLRRRGVQIEYVTLHVGLGTFMPVKVEQIEKHQMHAEWAEIDALTAQRLNAAKKEQRRIIAVGTTSVRTLEAFSKSGRNGHAHSLHAGKRWINTFIYPGYQFKFIDGMITNFHVPESTLLMLVAAFTGRKRILAAYETAIKKKYRFFSFGDAMLIS